MKMAKFEIKKVEDSKHCFFQVLKDAVICFQSDCEEECKEYVLKERSKKSVEMRQYRDYKLSKLSVNYAENRDMQLGYDNCDYYPKDEQDEHLLSIYLDIEANDDGCIMYRVVDFKDDKFVAEFYGSFYGKKSDKIIEEVIPKVIHGEKELRKVLKSLEVRRVEILELSN